MRQINPPFNKLLWLIEHGLPLIILAILIIFTAAKFLAHPYQGFRMDSNGVVARLYVLQAPHQPALKLGDKIIQIGNTTWAVFQNDLWKSFFPEIRPGNQVSLLVKRGDQQITIPWHVPGPNQNEIIDLLFNEGWLGFIFWAAGTIAVLILRPKDQLWRLMIAFNYLTAIWITLGSGLSFYHIWGAAIFFHMFIWVSVPVYLRLHWLYPQPFKKLPNSVTVGIYVIAIGFAIAELFQLFPKTFYLVGFLMSVGGSGLLLVAHAILQPKTRRDLLIVAFLAFMPAMLLGFISAFGMLSLLSGATIISLALLPFTYLYACYRRQLGKSELRVNQLIVVYLFILLLGIVLVPLTTLANTLMVWNEADKFIEVAVVFFTALVSILVFPRFKTFVEQRLLGIRLPPAQLIETYSARITTSPSFDNLQNLLKDEVLPSLLVREFVFLQFTDNTSSKVFLDTGLTEEQYPQDAELPELIRTAGEYRPLALLEGHQPCPWARLALPLKMEDKLTGLWLFGRRDPDDVYSQSEIPILQSLAHQTAIAQSNILQTERLETLSLANINRHEEERLRLAHDLHDSVLNQMAVLLMNLGDITIPMTFQKNYGELSQRLRSIVSDLRPPMLNYGLKPAFDELAESLMERHTNTNIVVDIQTEGTRYPVSMEQHLYRIAQQACENSLRHGQAAEVVIAGRLDPEEIRLEIKDNGVGFDLKAGLNLDGFLANKHFGLAGMLERGRIIGADVNIESALNQGTRIQLGWVSKGKQHV